VLQGFALRFGPILALHGWDDLTFLVRPHP
jgi:hypothetical protein